MKISDIFDIFDIGDVRHDIDDKDENIGFDEYIGTWILWMYRIFSSLIGDDRYISFGPIYRGNIRSVTHVHVSLIFR